MVSGVMERTAPETRRWGTATITGWVGAAAFAVSGVWFGAIAGHVSVAAPPTPDAGVAPWFAWFATTLQQERFDTAIAVVGFTSVIVLARCIAGRNPSDRDRAGSTLLALGAAVWIVGNVLQLGGHRAVGLLATHGNPIGTTNAIAFTIDTIDDAFELTAFAVLAVGFVLVGLRAASVGWHRVTLGAAAVLALIAVAYVTGPDALVDTALVLGGLLVMPVWLVWTGRSLDGGAFGPGSAR